MPCFLGHPPHSDDLQVKLFDHCEDIGVVFGGDVVAESGESNSLALLFDEFEAVRKSDSKSGAD